MLFDADADDVAQGVRLDGVEFDALVATATGLA
jgi:hypothetical protein